MIRSGGSIYDRIKSENEPPFKSVTHFWILRKKFKSIGCFWLEKFSCFSDLVTDYGIAKSTIFFSIKNIEKNPFIWLSKYGLKDRKVLRMSPHCFRYTL